MRFLLILLFVANFASAQWAGIASNQEVTENDMNYAMITSPYIQQKAATPNGLASLHCLTKAQLVASFYVDPANTTLAAKASNQLVTKADVTKLTTTGYFVHSHSVAQTTGAGACGTTLANTSPMYTSVNTAPTIGTTFYSNSTLTTTYGGSSQWWLVTYDTGAYYVVQISGVGVVLATYTCSSPPIKS